MLAKSRRRSPDPWFGVGILDRRVDQLDGATGRVFNFLDHPSSENYVRMLENLPYYQKCIIREGWMAEKWV